MRRFIEPIRQFTDSVWFLPFSLACVGLGIILWQTWPGLSWQPLLIILLPWAVRLAAGRFPFTRTPFDLPLVVFLLTALIGVWMAYDPGAAKVKFWWLLGGVILCQTIASQPRKNLWLATGLISLLGIGMAFFFVLSIVTQPQPVKISLGETIGSAWVNLQPLIKGGGINPNQAAGVIALALPFSGALGIQAWRQNRPWLGGAGLVFGAFSCLAILLTGSRGAWMAIIGAGSVTLLCWAGFNLFRFSGRQVATVLLTGFAVLVPVVYRVLAYLFNHHLDLVSRVPGWATAWERFQLAQNAFRLVSDFPITGSGLGTFPGLYSHYILGIPHFFYGYSHNTFLDVSLEQGLFGFLAFGFIYLASLWRLISHQRSGTVPLLPWATFFSLWTILFHGFVDNAIYNNGGSSLVFLIPALAVAITSPSGTISGAVPEPTEQTLNGREEETVESRRRPLPAKISWMNSLVLFGLVSVFVLSLAMQASARATWYANLGALEMARYDLADFPTGSWDEGHNLASLEPAEILFSQALSHEPGQRTANHRQGLIASLRRDFTAAAYHLERAYQRDPGHPGIVKALAYNYVWAGQYRAANELLGSIPEARPEIEVYVSWWAMQDRPDLAERARAMLEIVD
jgi:O-antigen ligase